MYRNVSSHARDTHAGLLVPPGGDADLDPSEPHDAAQIDAGYFRQVADPEPATEPPAPAHEHTPRKRTVAKES